MKTVLNTTEAPAAIGPYVQANRIGDLIITSVQLPVNPATGEMPATIEEQTAQSLKNIAAILASAGVGMDKVVKTTVFLRDMNDFAAVNEVYARRMAQPYPARSCVAVAALPKGALVEVEILAQK